MDHLAIMSKKGKLLEKILLGIKTIESRWSKHKIPPLEKITAGDEIYFKETGEAVTVKAKVVQVIFYKDLNYEKIKEILLEYGKGICADMSYADQIKHKKYCTLIFLEKVEKVEPFAVDKQGYGMGTAWITIDAIDKLRADPNTNR